MSQRTLIQYGTAAVLCAAALGGYLAWNSYQAEQLQVEMERQAALRRAEAKRLSEELNRQVGMTSLSKPWTTGASANEYLSQCEKLIGAAPLALSGWVFVQAKCEPASVLLSYKRGIGGTTQAAIDDVAARFGSAVRPEFDEFDGIVNLRFTHKLQAAGDDPLLPMERRRVTFVSHFQAAGVAANMKEQPSELLGIPILPDGSAWPKDIPLPKPTWRTFAFSLETTTLPTALFENLVDNALRPDFVEVKMNNGSQLTWTVKGKFYGK